MSLLGRCGCHGWCAFVRAVVCWFVLLMWTNVCWRVQLCSTVTHVHQSVLMCIVCKCVLMCTNVYWFALMCIDAYWLAFIVSYCAFMWPMCTNVTLCIDGSCIVFWCVLMCVFVHWCAPVWIHALMDVYSCVLMCTDVCWWELVRTNVYLYVQLWTNEYRCALMCANVTYVYSCVQMCTAVCWDVVCVLVCVIVLVCDDVN